MRRLQKTIRDGADVTRRGSSFQTLEPATTGKARSPAVDNRAQRMISDGDGAEYMFYWLFVCFCFYHFWRTKLLIDPYSAHYYTNYRQGKTAAGRNAISLVYTPDLYRSVLCCRLKGHTGRRNIINWTKTDHHKHEDAVSERVSE